ncbi:MAG: acyl CoA:acetate/3-ketoacid CoA transferase [Desulfobacterales bacterium]|nr:acyl CoA:acetate/3-ketoacid CoA transferase [Desulfobacterales bacterium]
MKKGKIVSMREAVEIIQDADTVATEGFVGIGFAEGVAVALEERFVATGHPRDLTLIYAAGQGDGKERGLNHLAHENLVRRVIGGHWGLAPKLQKLALENKIVAYNLPQGVISIMFRDIAAKRPRTITTVGLGTFVDPRNGGGKINALTTEEIVELIAFDGHEYLAYKPLPIDIAIIRGTTGDMDGNISMEKEALFLEALPMAMAAKNSGGLVIAQVERLADRGFLRSREIKIPGILVDCVVVAQKPEHHQQTFAVGYNPAYTAELKVPLTEIAPLALDERKIINRRAAFELRPNAIVNLGIGMPEGLAAVSAEEGILDLLTLTAEPGIIGGIPSGGMNFGAATNVEVLVDQPAQFDFYDGGGLDIAFLGLAEADRQGNVNVSKFGPKLAGAGGFINISQNAKRVCFLGTFSAGGLKVAIAAGKLVIEQEGRLKKLMAHVEHVTFSGPYATIKNQPVLYITERCVFRLGPDGMELIEIAPGVEIEKDILAHMDFAPIMRQPPTPMDPRIFMPDRMGIKADMLDVPIADRILYNPDENMLFINFEGLTVDSPQKIETIKARVETLCREAGKRVITVVNYDNFNIRPELIDHYTQMVKYVVETFYDQVHRYTTSAFLRMKLGDELKKRHLAPHMYETAKEARAAIKK